jgi:hypothetical protein
MIPPLGFRRFTKGCGSAKPAEQKFRTSSEAEDRRSMALRMILSLGSEITLFIQFAGFLRQYESSEAQFSRTTSFIETEAFSFPMIATSTDIAVENQKLKKAAFSEFFGR